MGKVSVSWHADSSLESNSSVGVYHCLPTQRAAKWDWRIALRRSPESGADAKDVLPVSVSTKDGDAYFLLGTFNENNQHCVLAGSEANRISSTHRVAVTEEDTYQYILKRVKGALKRFRTQLEGQSPSKLNARVIAHCQQVLTEVEMEWIAQYWLQGAQHDKMHIWWQRPMKTLEAFWSSLEDLTFRLYQTCMNESTVVPRAVIEGLLAELTARQKHRQQWDERRADKIYQRRISAPYRPVAKPLFEEDNKLGKDLTKAIGDLSRILVKIGPATTEDDVDRKKKKGKNAKHVESKPTIKANEEQSESQCKEKQAARSQTMDNEALEASDRQRKRSIEKAPGEGRKKNKKRRKTKPVKLV
jgi:DNA-binding protein Fis